MKYLFALFIVIFLVGCTEQQPIVGNDTDEYGCKASAGFSWCAEKEKCLRAWEEPCELSNEHVCTEEENLATACTLEYAPVCGKAILNTGGIMYQTFGNGCSACSGMKVVSYTPGECSVEIPTDTCSDQKGSNITLAEAVNIAKSSECGDNLNLDCACPSGYELEGNICTPNCYYETPQCGTPSIQCERTYFCNIGTGTYWINLNLEKEGCNPACVVDIVNKSAEINWRCTGLVI
jgi:hypothetical protein